MSTRTASPGLAAVRMACAACRSLLPLVIPPDGSPLVCDGCGHQHQQQDGILLLDDAGSSDPMQEHFPLLERVEARHFWFAARKRLILGALRRSLGDLAGRRIVDVGCGNGFVAAAIEPTGAAVVGVDLHLAGLRFARQRLRGPLLCTAAAQLPFDRQFDAALLCDVLEHIDDDQAALTATARMVRQGGIVLITVPANPRLWTPLDDLSGHRRRYTRPDLERLVARAGLRLESVESFGTLLLPFLRLQRLALRRQAVASKGDQERLMERALRVPWAPMNSLLSLLMRADGRFRRNAALPASSLLAVAGLAPSAMRS